MPLFACPVILYISNWIACLSLLFTTLLISPLTEINVNVNLKGKNLVHKMKGLVSCSNSDLRLLLKAFKHSIHVFLRNVAIDFRQIAVNELEQIERNSCSSSFRVRSQYLTGKFHCGTNILNTEITPIRVNVK